MNYTRLETHKDTLYLYISSTIDFEALKSTPHDQSGWF